MVLTYAFDVYGVIKSLAEDALDPGAWVIQTRIPDDIPSRLRDTGKTLFVMRKTGGGIARNFHGFMERALFHFSLYFTPELDYLPLARQVSKLYFDAWANQVVTPYGHLGHCRNGVGWEDVSDPELPLYGRAIAQFEFLIRPPRPPAP